MTGTQGVLIPRQNVADLMLNNEVVESVRSGQFAVYPVDTVEQGIEILTGVAAGKPDKKGRYPAKSVFGRVDARLREMARGMKNYDRAVRA